MPKSWSSSKDPNIVTTLRIRKYPENRKKKTLNSLEFLDWMESVPQWAAFCFGHPYSCKQCQAKNRRQHKLSTTSPHPLMTLHWNFYSAWKDSVRTKDHRYWLTKVRGWIQNRHCLLWDDSVSPIRMPFYMWWHGGGCRGERKVKKHRRACWVTSSQTRVQLPNNQRSGQSGEYNQLPGLEDTQEVS